jgi:hypothetical protein
LHSVKGLKYTGAENVTGVAILLKQSFNLLIHIDFFGWSKVEQRVLKGDLKPI